MCGKTQHCSGITRILYKWEDGQRLEQEDIEILALKEVATQPIPLRSPWERSLQLGNTVLSEFKPFREYKTPTLSFVELYSSFQKREDTCLWKQEVPKRLTWQLYWIAWTIEENDCVKGETSIQCYCARQRERVDERIFVQHVAG